MQRNEENNRIGKTRYLFKKIRDAKGNISCKDGLFLTEAEAVKKRWKEYTEELYKKDLHTKIILMVCSLTQSQTSWNVKSNGPEEASLQKLVEVREFQLSYFKS